MKNRHWFVLDLPDYDEEKRTDVPSEFAVRAPVPDDVENLAVLMLRSYAGTIDDDDGTIDDARNEVRNLLQGEYGKPLLEASRIALDADGIGASATLLTRWGEQDLPLVAFVMTDPAHQGKRLAAGLMQLSLSALKGSGEPCVRAVVTDGNFPSERLFLSLGFRKVPERIRSVS